MLNKLKWQVFLPFFLMFPVHFAAAQSLDGIYPFRTDWTESFSKTNISAYVFNDLNDNGVYDLGDRAFADIAVAAALNNVAIAASRTNVNGFANFSASNVIEDVSMSELGMYEFVALVPPGWRVTTGNQTQSEELIAIEGSISGVGFAEMLTPIGLARHKFIRGTYAGTETGRIALMQGDDLVAEASLSPDEQFLWPVDSGLYSLVSAIGTRPVKVGRYPVDVGSVGMFDPAPGDGRLIGFDDMAPSGLQKAPNGYGGLNWFNLNILSASMTSGSIGYQNGTSSGNNILYTSSGHPSKIYADAPFDFFSVNLTVAWPVAEGETAIFEFYRGDELVLREEIGLSAYGPVSYQPRIPDVTHIEVSSKHFWQLVLDDVEINTN